MGYRLTRRAEADLTRIFSSSYSVFGPIQAERYRDSLVACCGLLGGNPEMGRPVPIRPGLRRHEHGRHVIFYRQNGDGILILAVLHQRQIPDLGRIR